ncbi:carbohydrate ABC transporter permease [Cohnella abietis]|uniref:Sugar ABC transporter permease n=1 Tax=Cohnella abietis TaxID=2507935 RepID=A0A3T1DBD6_9BACL|nr:carbohydrate ABC transporter permease [Cohnella abietis]BBI35412.1 sugar ABC transporter permease [Cohnella abietis]
MHLSANAKGDRLSRRVGSALIFLFLILGAVVMLFPIYMGLLNSVKTQSEMLTNILSLPTKFQFKNYASAFEKIHFFRSLWNTIQIAGVGLIGIIVCASLAGYKLSRTKGGLSSALFGLFILSMLIPFHSIMITLVKISNKLSIQGSIYGLGMIYIGLGVSMAIFLYHGFVKSIPRDLDEAAIIDGCGEFKLFYAVIFPLLMPVTATIAILNLLWMWNDFLLPLLILTNSDGYTLLLSTNMLFGQYSNDWSNILSALILAMLPVVIFYLILQKYILNGIAEGAIKG